MKVLVDERYPAALAEALRASGIDATTVADLRHGGAPDADVTTLAAAVARIWRDVLSNAVDPGWVPIRMGGPSAPDDLQLGHLTQEWLARSDDPEARTSGGYWYHQRRAEPAPAVHNRRFRDELLEALAGFTATSLPRHETTDRACAEQ